jgi:hypothetical protein
MRYEVHVLLEDRSFLLKIPNIIIASTVAPNGFSIYICVIQPTSRLGICVIQSECPEVVGEEKTFPRD